MRLKKINSTLLAVALTLAIVSAFLMPAAVVSADGQDWPLQLVGATTVNITQAEFEALAAANPASYTDADGTWTGVALWRLIALVDDGDSATFNDALASVYSIQLTAADGYAKTIAPPYAGVFEFARSENIIVANQLNGAPIPMTNPAGTKMWYPLRVTGSGCTASSQKVGALVKVELLNLPVTAVSVAPASQAVANGATFTIDMNIDTDTASRGWQMNVNFDASKLTANSVTEGSFLSAYAAANGGMTIPAGAATIDNVAGTITIPGYAIMGAGTGGPTGTGTLCTISFTAKTGIDDFAGITPTGVVIADVTGTAIPGPVATGGTVAIGDVPMPDLVVSALSAAKVSDTTYTVTYTITNQGNAATGACTTSIVIDGGAPITVACPALAALTSDTQTTSAQTLSDASDTIVVTADSAGVVSESNEGNNARTITYAAVGDDGGTSLNGNIAAKLMLTAPADIDPWNLVQGTNDITGSANVKCNTDWQLQVNDEDTTTGGHMTKWMLGVYDSGTKLTAPLNVGCTTSVDLSGTPQTIVTGTTAGQSGDDGQNLTINFHQPVFFADPVLTGGYSYHIVVTFTASVTI
ncbi:MAG: CARDB domain-containing protein [Dehalococcoidia bacterium]